jgi:primosomal protein N' (replication factor Y)
LPDPLTYEVPPNLAPLARPGVRARVRIGKRRLTGIVVRVHGDRPENMTLRPIEEILDVEPPLPPDLMELARFTADYYLAPLGEVFRSMLPSDLPPWGDRRVWLTNAGALAPPRNADEAAVIEALREGGRMSVGELQGKVGLPDLSAVLAGLSERGRIAGEERNPRSARYVAAVELAPGGLATHLAAAGRSAARRRARR